MDQVMAAFVQVQTFCGGIGAHQDQTVLMAEALSDRAALLGMLRSSTHRQHFAVESALAHCALQEGHQGVLAVGVFRVDEDIGPRGGLADGLQFRQGQAQLGIFIQSCLGHLYQPVQCLSGVGDASAAVAFAPLGAQQILDPAGDVIQAGFGEVGRHIFRLQGSAVLLLFKGEGAIALQPLLKFPQAAQPLFAGFGVADPAADNLAIAIADHGQRVAASRHRGHRALEQRHEGQNLPEAPLSHRLPQAWRNCRQQRLLKHGELRLIRCVELHGPWRHLPGAEQRFASFWVLDVALEPPHHVLAVALSPEPTTAIHKARIEQLHQRGEVGIETIVGGGGKQQEPIAARSQHLSQASTPGILPVAAAAKPYAMMRLIDDHQIPDGALQLLQHLFLLGEVHRGEAVGHVVEGIGSQHQLAAALLQLPRAADRFKAQPKALPHFPLPLLQQRASRRHDQDPVGTAAGDQLCHHQACLDRLAQAHTICY